MSREGASAINDEIRSLLTEIEKYDGIGTDQLVPFWTAERIADLVSVLLYTQAAGDRPAYERRMVWAKASAGVLIPLVGTTIRAGYQQAIRDLMHEKIVL